MSEPTHIRRHSPDGVDGRIKSGHDVGQGVSVLRCHKSEGALKLAAERPAEPIGRAREDGHGGHVHDPSSQDECRRAAGPAADRHASIAACLWMVGLGMFLDACDIYLAGGVLGSLVKSGWSDLAANASFMFGDLPRHAVRHVRGRVAG